MGWSLWICISYMFPGDAAVLAPHFENHSQNSLQDRIGCTSEVMSRLTHRCPFQVCSIVLLSRDFSLLLHQLLWKCFLLAPTPYSGTSPNHALLPVNNTTSSQGPGVEQASLCAMLSGVSSWGAASLWFCLRQELGFHVPESYFTLSAASSPVSKVAAFFKLSVK